MPISLIPRNKNFRSVLFSLILFGWAAILFGAVETRAEQVTLAWDPNVESDLAGYRLHLGTAPNAYHAVLDVGNRTSFTVTDLNRGTTYYFSITAYNTQGLESDFSNEVDKTVVKQYQLTVGKRGSGLGTVTGEGINCGEDCQGLYDEGSQVTLNVAPADGSVFTGWSGDDCSGLGECVLTMWSDKGLYAGMLSQADGVAKKNRNVQIATGSTRPAGGIGTGGTVLRSKESRAYAPAGESSTSYYTISRKTDLRGNVSRYESLATREAVLRTR